MRAVLLTLVLLVASPLAACGYQAGQIAGGGRTLFIPPFVNTTWRRDLERDLTRAVHQEVLSRSGYSLAGDGAELVMTGRLVEVAEGVLSEAENAEIRESSVRMVVEITVVETATGRTVVDKVRLSERKSFAPVKGETVRTAENAAIRALAERIVYTLSGGW